MLWTPLFFGAKKPVLGLINITALLGTVIKITKDLRGIDSTAHYLYLPYCAWLAYATYLNAGSECDIMTYDILLIKVH